MNKFETALAAHPEVEKRPEIMVLRHTYLHSPEDPEGWKVGAAGINKYYRTFSAWAFGKKDPVDGFLDPTPEERFADRPEFELESLHRSAMIGTPDEVIERLRHYEELGVTEFSFWSDNSLSHDEKKRSLQLFIEHVVPAFTE